MQPLSTHLFSHWSIPLNRGIFLDFLMYFCKYLPLSKLFAPRSKVSKICFSWIAVLFGHCSDVKKTKRYKDLLFLSFSFFKQAVLHTRVLYTLSSLHVGVFLQWFISTIKSSTAPGLKTDSNAKKLQLGLRVSFEIFSCTR
jgi:hypothetical protein